MPDKRCCCCEHKLYGCDYTQYTELFPHHWNALLLQGSVKTFQLLFSFYALKKISKAHQVHRNYPSSITFSQLWWNFSQLACLFNVKVALSPDLNTAHWFAKIDFSASVQKQQVYLSDSAVLHENLSIGFLLHIKFLDALKFYNCIINFNITKP